ncbi:hypothetical protein CRUP_006870 [Coryphaenoides rupestris]|nr:hypothetical protein CRUP_006870 [Coryphaenoides rupestris]
MQGGCPSLGEVQQTLLRFVSAETVLVGHGLETHLCSLKVSLAARGETWSRVRRGWAPSFSTGPWWTPRWCSPTAWADPTSSPSTA